MKFNFTFMRSMAVLLACFTAFSLQAQSDVTVTVTAPASVAGDYAARQAAFGPGLTADVSGSIIEVIDGTAETVACDTVTNDLTGAIALIDRGACAFVTKVQNAQEKGAVAVIVCNNNTAAPNAAIVMGGDDMGTVVIPSVMLSYNQCQTIRAELANGLAATLTTSTLIPSGPGEVCEQATVITDAGTYTATLDSGYGGVFGGTGNAAWYSFTPTENTLITVTSCATTAEDTRLIIVGGCTDPTGAEFINFNDDCDPDNGNFASELSWLGVAGTEYLILWDDRWSGAPFDWQLILAPPPVVDVTVTVDMSNEATTGTDNGGHIAGSFNGWSSVPMTDNGDSTYSFTITGLTAGDSIEYKFQNGENMNWEEFADGDPCTITDASGNFVNRLLVPGIENSSLDAVCFNSCGACVPVATCEEPIFLINDDIESYGEGNINGAAAHWGAWPGTDVSGTVTTAQAFSGSQSVLIDGTNPGEDAIFVLNNENDIVEGHYWLTWKMYIPAGKGAYWNIQHAFPSAPNWAIDAFYDADGTGTINLNDGGSEVPFEYPEDEWFDVLLLIDIDNDEARLIQGDLTVTATVTAAWTFSNASGTATTALNSVNFFPIDANNEYYIDDVALAVIPPAGDGQYCYTAPSIDPGVHTVSELSCFGAGYFINDSGLSGQWYSYTASEDGYIAISSCGGGADSRGWIFEGEDCHSLSTLGVNDDMCDLGNGSLWASYREAPVTAGNTYYILWDDMWETTGFDWELTFTAGALPEGEFCQSALPAMVNTDMLVENFGDAAVAGPIVGNFGASTTPYAQSIWYTWTPETADTVDVTSCDGGTDTRLWIYTGECGSLDDLTLVASSDDDCGASSLIEDWVPTAGTTYYIEWDNEFSSDAFIWRIEQEIIIDVDEIDLNSGISVFPNPATDLLNVQFDLDEAVDMEVRLINTLGQTVSVKELNNVQGETINFNVSNLATGTYYVQFITENASTSQKVILTD